MIVPGPLWVCCCCRNPCTTSDPKYRDRIILAAADCLQQLDGEEVKPAHRAFLQALHSRRARARRQELLAGQQEQLSQQASGMHLGCDTSTGAVAAAAAGQLNMQQLPAGRTDAAVETEAAVSGVKFLSNMYGCVVQAVTDTESLKQ